MNDNVISIKQSERFGVFLGELDTIGELKQKERIGSAYIKRGDKKFRLRIWMLPDVSYFVIPHDKDPKKYVILIPSPYRLANGEMKTSWRRVGEGTVAGTYIRLRFYLFTEDFFLSMFPDDFHIREQNSARSLGAA